MLSPARPWICSGCLRGRAAVSRRWYQRRWFQLAAAANPVDRTPLGARVDDSILRQIFDSPSVWKAFAASPTGRKNVGLFCNAYLTGPEGFGTFARVSLRRARRIVDKVMGATTREEYRAIVRDLDRLSDVLCRILDMADFVRVTHPDRQIQQAASEAWALVYQYMNELNTTTGLNDQLGRAMDDPDVAAAWTEEEATVARMLKLDFTKSAVNLPRAARDRFVQLSQRISEAGSAFVEGMAPEQKQVVLPSSRFQGLDPTIARSLSRRGSLYLPTASAESAAALRSVHDPETRKAVYYAARTASRQSVDALEDMLRLRAELAALSGFESYGHMALRDRMMARSPESVGRFLSALAENNAPGAQREVADLVGEKRRQMADSNAELEPWDKDYYADSIRRSLRTTRVRHNDFLPAYFSLGTVMQGLSRIFSRLYGIRFVPRESLPGETWHPDVRRLDVVSDADGHVAVLYCDLFYRDDKSPNPAHFTVRCSREISHDEVAEVAGESSEGSPFETAEDAANDGMALAREPDGTLKQLPTIALVCDFAQAASASASRGRPALLDFFQMETLFHEMGHAIHSVLARTSLQNVAGTRCATDLAELPSTLMESLASDPAVLALFARHHETDEPLPYELVAERLRLARRFEGCDTENQIVLAMLDQELHSGSTLDSDSTAAYHRIQRTHGRAPADPPGTRWQGFFGHLFGYGSTYYSYLFDRVLAERVWAVVFDSGADGAALDRERGERLKENLLRWGGSRDPWHCLATTLRDPRVAGGDEEAMALVGSWGGKRRT